jgi:hypothetical protein
MECFTIDGDRFLIDDEDLEKISNINWRLSGDGYILAYKTINKKRKLRLHRLILDAPDNLYVDHINGVKTDNRKSNLRLCSKKENRRNSKPDLERQYKGVFVCNPNKFRVIIDGTHMGYFSNIEAAANCYNFYAKILHKEFARLNEVNVSMDRSEWERYKKQKASIFKGVSSGKNGYKVSITINKKSIYIGFSKSEKEAALLYNNYLLENNIDKPLNEV